ncbi:hypothetical protein WIW50_19775 [Flavobacteriaceae bacterium 3-367]
MKKLIGLVFLMFILISAAEFTSSKPQTEHTIEGTWELVNRFNYDGLNVTDTIPNTNGYRQIKMFHKGKVMWTRYSPDDPTEWFGYGRYRTTSDKLEESLEYGSDAMMKVIDTTVVFEFELHLDENTYSQITLDEQGNKTFAENYKRIR